MPKAPEAPIVFFLRVPPEETPVQPVDSQNYSDILAAEEGSRVSERFSPEIMKTILEKTHSPTYHANTVCFHCCHGFSWKPCVLPVSYDTYEKVFLAEGHYCSPECALADLYNKPRMSDTIRWNRHALLRDLYRELWVDGDLQPAPSRFMLRMFGGPLDIAQYREFLSHGTLQTEMPPIRLHLPSTNFQAPARDVKKFVSLSSEAVEKASNELRLKRSKPVHGNAPTLDRCLKGF